MTPDPSNANKPDQSRPASPPAGEMKSEGDLNLSAHRRAWQAGHIDATTQQWLEEDARYFLHQSLSTPCLNVMAKCEGAGFTDLEGRRYLDFHGNNVHQPGFGNPRVIEAIVRQMSELSFCTRRYTNIPAIKLAKRLVELAPAGLSRVLFAPGGTSAVGMAIKFARAATGRFKMISMWDSFHGASLDAISVGGEAIFRNGIGPLLPGCEHVPPFDNRHCPFACGQGCNLKCADYIEYVLEKEGDVAAIIGETVRSTPYIPPPDYWRRVRAACDRHGALLILDEIPHCLGRTGKMFTCEHFGVTPDILLIGKALGGGIFPLAAMLAREELNIAADRALGHYTHEKNPVAAAAGLAVLDFIESEGILERAKTLGEYALNRLNELKSRHWLIGDVRGLGLMLGVELVRDRETMSRACDEAERVMYAALADGLNFKVSMGNVITLTPALTITQGELGKAIGILDRAIQTVESKPG